MTDAGLCDVQDLIRIPPGEPLELPLRTSTAYRSPCSLTLATKLQLRQARDVVIGVSVGSGQGVALVLENPEGRRA